MGTVVLTKLKPGAHVFVACNAFMSQLVFSSLMDSGLEFRTQIIRLIQTLRGGDRPKLGEKDWRPIATRYDGCAHIFRSATSWPPLASSGNES